MKSMTTRCIHIAGGLLSSLLIVVLVSMVGCKTPDQRTEEANVLQDIRNTTVIPELGSYDESARKKSVERILMSLELAPEITKNLLVATLDDSMVSARTKRVICTILAEEGDLRALTPLTAMLAEGSVAQDDLLETALLNFGERAVPRIATVLAEGGEIARRNAAGILLGIGGPLAFDALRARLTLERDSEVRFLCVCGLVQDARSSSLPFLGVVLDDADEEVRKAAWGGLWRRTRPPGHLRFDASAAPSVRVRQAAQVRTWLEGGAVPL